MNRYTLEQRWDILQAYFQSQCCVAEAVRVLKRKFGRTNAPTAPAVRKLVKKVRETGMLIDNTSYPRSRPVCSAANIAAVAESVRLNPKMSIRHRAQQLNISRTSLRRILMQKPWDTLESTPEEAGTSKLESDIIREVEHYFRDENLRRDKFLLEQIGKDEDGWVPFTVLLTFKRLAALSTDIEVIANALMKSEEGLVEISEDKTKIRRHPEKPIPEHNEERRKEIASRTAYVKGFPLDTEMSDLIEFFNPFEKVANIIMRKYSDKATKTYKFKGSVFVTFVKKEQCEAFINKEKVQYKDRDLIRLWQEKYFEQKKTEERASKIELPKGVILHFKGCDKNISPEIIRESLAKFVAEADTNVAFIDYKKGEKGGYVRLTTENTAKTLLDKLEDKKIKLEDNVELEFRTLSEEEETEYLKKSMEQMKQRRNNQNKNRSNRKRRDVDKDYDEPPTKQKH